MHNGKRKGKLNQRSNLLSGTTKWKEGMRENQSIMYKNHYENKEKWVESDARWKQGEIYK